MSGAWTWLAVWQCWGCSPRTSARTLASPAGQLLGVFHGRSAALFLFLAGVSLALISGGPARSDRPALRRSRIKIAARAGVLLILGLSLTSLNTEVDVILPVYAVLFLLALPLLRLRPRTLALLASALAIGGPVLSYLIRGLPPPHARIDTISARTVGADVLARPLRRNHEPGDQRSLSLS